MMHIKKFCFALSIFLLSATTEVFALPGNLYIKFQEKMDKQQVDINIKDGNHSYAISCRAQKTKLKTKGPTCGFGFKNSSVLTQIKYKSRGHQSVKICEELNGTQFRHGILYITSQPGINSARCTFKKTKKNIYTSLKRG